MNILYVDIENNRAQWTFNNNLQGEWIDCKLVETSNTYKITSLDDTIVYAIAPLQGTFIKYMTL
jgi:hypothetical protein